MTKIKRMFYKMWNDLSWQGKLFVGGFTAIILITIIGNTLS